LGQRIAIVGAPTKGKSTSYLPNPDIGVIGLNPAETVVITFSGKQLPVRGANKIYPKDKKISEGGNFMYCKDVKDLPAIITYISDKRPEIKNVVLEDMQYSMSNEYMARAKENGYNKFVDIGVNFASWMKKVQDSRDDMFCWIIWHPENAEKGLYNMKTLGNMIDSYLNPEGLMDLIFHADCEKSSDNKMKYYLVTNNDGRYPARTPSGMFEELHIPNDLGKVRKAIEEYYG
jgi:hypothetical protein